MTVPHDPSTGGTTPARALVVSSAALFTDMLVHGLTVPVLPRLPAVVGAGFAATGMLFTSYAAAMIIVTLFAGRVINRHGPRTPLLIGPGGLATATLLFATGGPCWLLMIARLTQGIAGGVSWVAAPYPTATIIPMEKHGQSIGIALSTITLGVLVGPPLIGLLVEHFGTASPFSFAAAVAVVDGAMRIILMKGSPRVTDDITGPLAVLRVPGSFSIVFAVVVDAAVLSGVEPVPPTHLKASSLTVGLLFGFVVLASITADPVVGRFATAVSPWLFVGSGVVAAATALVMIGAADEMRQASAGMVLLGASSTLLLMPSAVLVNQQGSRSVPPTLGGSFALYNPVYTGGLTGGPLLIGFAVQHAGFTAAVTVIATVLVGLGVVTVARLPRSLQKPVDLA